MATPVSDTLGLLRELNKDKASRRKTASDQLMQMTKLSNERDIKLMSTKIALADRKMTADQAKFDANSVEFDALNESISLVMGKTEMIGNPLERTTGAVDAAKSIEDVLALMKDESRILKRNIASQANSMRLAKQKYGHYNELSKFFEGEGVSDFDESGSIDADDVTLENYFKSNNIDRSDLDAGTIGALESFDKTGYRDKDKYLELDIANKELLQSVKDRDDASSDELKEESDELMQTRMTLINSRGISSYKNSRAMYLSAVNSGTTGGDLDDYKLRHNLERFGIAPDMQPELLEGIVSGVTYMDDDGNSVPLIEKGNVDFFLDSMNREIDKEHGYDVFEYRKSLKDDLDDLVDDGKSNGEAAAHIKIKLDVLDKSEQITEKYLGALREANDDNPSYKSLINEIEGKYERYLSSNNEGEKDQLRYTLRQYYGFDPESNEDINWMKREHGKSVKDDANKALDALGIPLSVEDGDIDSDKNSPFDMPSTQESIYDEPLEHATPEEIESNANALDIGAFQGENNDGAQSADYDTNDLSFLYEPITMSADSVENKDEFAEDENQFIENEGFDVADPDIIESLDAISQEDKEWNAYVENAGGFVDINPHMSLDNNFNLSSESLDSVPKGTVTLPDGSEFSGRINWVTSDVWGDSGTAMGTLNSKDEDMSNVRYNDSSSLLADRFPVVNAAGIQDKDYIRTTINYPDFNLREKLDSGEIKTPIDFIRVLKEFVEKDNNGYKIGLSSDKDDAIDLLSLFFKEETVKRYDFGNPLGQMEVKTVLVDKDPAQEKILQMISEVMLEYHNLKNPETYGKVIGDVKEKYSKKEALAAVYANELSKDAYNRAFPGN